MTTSPSYQRACHVTEALGIDPGHCLEEAVDAHPDQTVHGLLHFAVSEMFDLLVYMTRKNLSAFHAGAAPEESLRYLLEDFKWFLDIVARYGAVVAATEPWLGDQEARLAEFIGGPIQECCSVGCDEYTAPGLLHCSDHKGAA